ncbi:MAG: hypothetical protein ACLBM3_20190 [Dolichospermum sp.]|jgi:hypothetical protein|nr:hypothetical protein [Dolichospermum sp. DET73]MBS9387189.1 hypothetical protein [Dolichospermum sp. BR01]MBS9390331.1 hypothetical protein [Dolichospermum sp. WA123]
MLIITLKNNEFLSEISNQESANINGGGLLTAAAYITVSNLIPQLAGSAEQANTALLLAINVLPGPGGNYNSP